MQNNDNKPKIPLDIELNSKMGENSKPENNWKDFYKPKESKPTKQKEKE